MTLEGILNDDPLWLVLAVSAYIKETGDWSILDELAPFDNKPGTEASIYTHLQRSLQYTVDRMGPHGLPLIGRADWNDCLNLNIFSDTPGQPFQTASAQEGKIAESIFIGGLFILANEEMEGIAAHIQQDDDVVSCRNDRLKMEQVVNAAGWDGDWFRRAYDHFGQPVGSCECIEGQIFVEPQGMCVMAGVGLDNGKAKKALDSVKERLAFEHGIVLLNPAYTKYYLHLGEISPYPPGYKENGSVFCHTNPWIMIAETMIGRGDRAFDYYKRINPSAREAISEIHRCEPYAYAQTIAGKEAMKPGEAKNSWLTGTAAWNYVAITQWILGIRPTLDGLQVSPVIPEEWKGFEISRNFRGVNYDIKVKRNGKGNEVSLEVNGFPIPGTVIPIPAAGVSEVHVLARLR